MKKLLVLSTVACQLAFIFPAKAQYHVLANLNYTSYPQGPQPQGSLVRVGNKLYGTAFVSAANGQGDIYSINLDGTGYTDMYDFLSYGSDDAGNPLCDLTVAGKKLYGFSYGGGVNSSGAIFSIDTDGSNYTVLYSFNAATGEYPEYGAMTLYKDKLYGMTNLGGAHNDGVVYSYDTTTGVYADLLDFDTTNGSQPIAQVIYSNGKLYGMTHLGGAHTAGLVFSVDTNGNNYHDLLDSDTANGEIPYGGLLLVGKKLYGMTDQGGAYTAGNIFSIDTNGNNFRDLFDFNVVDGDYAVSSLILSGNLLYGFTLGGGPAEYGNIFSIDTNGSDFTNIFDGFSYTLGLAPNSSPLLYKGVIYGTTLEYGPNTVAGVIFSDSICSLVHVTTSDTLSCYGLSTGAIYIDSITGASPSPYSYSWTGGGTSASLSNLSAGSYTVTVTDYNGCVARDTVVASQYGHLTVSDSVIASPLCNGTSNGIVTALVTGGKAPFTYEWANASSQNTISATGLSAGTYTVAVSDGCAASATASVGFTQPAALQITSYLKDSTALKSIAAVTVSGGTMPYTYSWNPGNETTDTITGLSAGTYTCTVTDSNGCSITSSLAIIPTGINEVKGESGEVSVYPNPGNGVFTFVLSHAVPMAIGIVSASQTIEVYNVLGEQVFETLKQVQGDYEINLSSQPTEFIYIE